MDIKRKKQLLEEYKNRHPQKGIISYGCKATKEIFFGISNDTKASFNSINMKLTTSWHSNKRLQELWNQYGEEEFDLSVVKVLKYENPHENHGVQLEELLEGCLQENKDAKKL